jgi:hypothetical protein
MQAPEGPTLEERVCQIQQVLRDINTTLVATRIDAHEGLVRQRRLEATLDSIAEAIFLRTRTHHEDSDLQLDHNNLAKDSDPHSSKLSVLRTSSVACPAPQVDNVNGRFGEDGPSLDPKGSALSGKQLGRGKGSSRLVPENEITLAMQVQCDKTTMC